MDRRRGRVVMALCLGPPDFLRSELIPQFERAWVRSPPSSLFFCRPQRCYAMIFERHSLRSRLKRVPWSVHYKLRLTPAFGYPAGPLLRNRGGGKRRRLDDAGHRKVPQCGNSVFCRNTFTKNCCCVMAIGSGVEVMHRYTAQLEHYTSTSTVTRAYKEDY